MAKIDVECPYCSEIKVIKNGKGKNRKQRYLCQNKNCGATTFMLEYSYAGSEPGIEFQNHKNGLKSKRNKRYVASPWNIDTKGYRYVKKTEKTISKVNCEYIANNQKLHEVLFDIVLYEQVENAELDEMWSFVHDKSNQRWLWLAINHDTGDVLAYTFGKRKDKVFEELKSLLKPFGITLYYKMTGAVMNVICHLKTILLVRKTPKQ